MKKRAFQKVYELIMRRHLELCVDLKDFRTAKDGLHQYRTMTQLVDPSSLEAVSLHLIELAEAKASEARMRADKVALAAAAKISDLDQEETPETIMLSSMSYEGARDRTNREVVVPWLKFLWETYRTILDLLYKNNRLEKVYHKTCEKAFKFCQDYQRHIEFRRLCEMLRAQFSNLQKATQQSFRTNKPAWEWTVEGVELHLQTRFVQLEAATSLELWNEGFRIVEDIYEIMQIHRKTPKSRLMVTYYEKLTRIFWVSENHLFHAYAWYRYYCLCLESKKDMRPEERATQASCVLLSALCIPNFRETEGAAAVLEEDEVTAEKNAHMALLLDFQANPTRQALLAEMVSKGVLQEVPSELNALYHIMESGFRPLNLVRDLIPLLNFVKSDPQLSLYSLPLQKVAVLRTVMQLSRVFSTLKMSYLRDLVRDLDLSYCDVEKLLVDCASNKQLHLRIDHYHSCIRFGTNTAVTAAIEAHAAQVGAKLNRVVEAIPSNKSEQQLMDRRAYLERIAEEIDGMYAAHNERRQLIERRKETLERLQQIRQQEEQRQRELEEARRREEEAERLRKEEEARKVAKEKKIKEQIDVAKTKKALEAHGKIVDESFLVELDETSRRALLKEAQSDAQRAKEEEIRRLMDQQKRLDYTTRALRLEAAEVIRNRYEEDVQADRREYESHLSELHVKQKEEHAIALIEKARLARVKPVRAAFESMVIEHQKAAFDARVAADYQKALTEHRKRQVARARQLHEDELERLEEEAEALRYQREKEEEARRQAEEAEQRRLAKLAAEEEKRAQAAELERRRQEQLALAAQRKREAEEAEAARRAADEAASWGRRTVAPPPQSVDADRDAGPSWRSGRGPETRAPPVAAAGDSAWRGSTRTDPRPSEGGGWSRQREDTRQPEDGGWSRAPRDAAEPPKMSGLDRLAALAADQKGDSRSGRWGTGSRDLRDNRDRPSERKSDEGRWR